MTLITLQSGALKTLKAYVPILSRYSQFVFLCHPVLKKLYGDAVLRNLKQFERPILELMIPEGERSKNLTQVKRCWQSMLARGIDRHAAVLL